MPGQQVVGALQQLVGTYRPPVPVTTDALTLLLLPPDPALLAMSRLAWVAALLWAAGALARDVTRRAGGDEARQARAGALAIVLTGTAPVVLALGASLMSEVPLAAASGVALVLLLRAMEQRTNMLYGVSHDLRTPLTRMRLAVEMLDP